MADSLILGLSGLVSKVFLNHFSRTLVLNRHNLIGPVLNRAPSQPVVTLMNHRCIVDDPLLWGILPLPTLFLMDSSRGRNFRYTLGAKELTFKNEATTWVFNRARIIPITRGRGIFQGQMDRAVRLMEEEGAWINIFPEAKVNQTEEMRKLRWGAARLIMASRKLPTVIPIYHTGFEKVFPEKQRYYPRPGKSIRILIGDPLDLGPFLRRQRDLALPEDEIRVSLMDVLSKEMLQLKARCEHPDFEREVEAQREMEQHQVARDIQRDLGRLHVENQKEKDK